MSAIEEYTALIDAVESQRDRLQGPLVPDYWGGETAKRFRDDPILGGMGKLVCPCPMQ